jgi:lipoprotein-releasing system ATP-binding protein
MAEEPLTLRVEQLVKEYGDGVVTRVLHGLDMELRRGELVALMGPSGSGKSTLLNIIGLLDRPTSGRVVLQGQDTSDLDDTALTNLRGDTLGFVFQFHHLLPAFTAQENVMLPAYARAGYGDAERRDLLEVLEDRQERRATIITSQLDPKHWHDYLTDPTLADAICDRVLSRAHRLVLKGPSRRKDTPNQ